MDSASTTQIETLLALLLVASATAIITKWVKVPYAVALVLSGLIIGMLGISPPITMTPDLVLLIFLPALLFEASWNLDIDALKRDWLPICALSTLGVLVCMASVAAILHFAAGFSIQSSLLFGAMISATDPVSIIALFRQMKVDRRLTMLLEGESLFNDGTAVVLFKVVLASLVAGSAISWTSALTSAAVSILGGALVGCALGFILSKATSLIDDHLLETMLTTLVAYGSYIAAERLHVSAVIAVVAAGIVVGNHGTTHGLSANTRQVVNSFWEYAAFVVNSLLFLLMGLQIKAALLLQHWQAIVIAVLAVVFARALVIYGICPFVSTRAQPIPLRWRHLMFFGGLRGALVMALALSLPLSFPERGTVINMVFGAVLFTLLVPGLTMERLISWLGMSNPKETVVRTT